MSRHVVKSVSELDNNKPQISLPVSNENIVQLDADYAAPNLNPVGPIPVVSDDEESAMAEEGTLLPNQIGGGPDEDPGRAAHTNLMYCPAIKQICSYCGKFGHFGAVCRTADRD